MRDRAPYGSSRNTVSPRRARRRLRELDQGLGNGGPEQLGALIEAIVDAIDVRIAGDDMRSDEQEQLTLNVRALRGAEQEPEQRQILEERNARARAILLPVHQPADHDGLAVAHEQMGRRLTRADDRRTELHLARRVADLLAELKVDVAVVVDRGRQGQLGPHVPVLHDLIADGGISRQRAEDLYERAFAADENARFLIVLREQDR